VLAVAACRPEPEWDSGQDQDIVTIYEIQTEHPDAQDPAVGSLVALRSVVVTAYDTYPESKFDDVQVGEEIRCVEKLGYTGGIVVQEIGGGPYSGISLFNPSVVPQYERLAPGDLVDVQGEYLEFCLTEDNRPDSYCSAGNSERLSQLGEATATRVGEVARPVALVRTLQELTGATTAEPYEGVLVRIEQRLQISPCQRPEVNCCSGDYNMHGSLCVGGTSEDGWCNGGIEVTNELYAIPPGTRCVSSVQGVLTWFFEYRLSPRGPEDVVIPRECLPM
jgi:hypothetical protein